MLTPYNYSGGTAKTATKTPTVSTGGSLKPFKYATYTPPEPVASTPPPTNPVLDYLKGIPSQIKNSFTSSFEQAVQGANEVGAGEKPLPAVASALKIGAGTAGVVFSPIAPVTELISKAIQFSGDKLAETPLIKSYVKTAPESDYRVLEALQNLGGVAMGILGAKGGDIKSGKVSPTKLEEIASHPDVVSAVQKLTEAQQKAHEATQPQGTLKPFDYSKVSDQKHADYAKSQGYEPYTPPDQLPTINTGTVPKGDLPTIQTEPLSTPRLGDLTLEPIKQVAPQLTTSYEKLVKATEIGDSATAEATLKEIKTQVTDLAAKVEQNSNANTFQSRVFERMKIENPDILEGDLSVKHMNLKEDATNAVDLVASDKQAAFETAMGQKVSKDVTSTATNIALAEKALQEGNHDLYARLIKKRSLDQTRRGQEIVAERGSVTDNSTSRYVKELIASRLDKLGGEYLGDIKTKLTKVSAKQKATRAIDAEVKALERKIKAKKLDTKTAVALLDKLACV